MDTISRAPLYNLKAVLKETGLKADVLRAWERRYDLPAPQRTAGGHRLYSAYDIETLKWLRARQAEGLSISRAVDLWQEMLAGGGDPLAAYSAGETAPAPAPAADTRVAVMRQSWLQACLKFDSLAADEVLNQAFAVYPVETVCVEILQGGISEIGNYWYLDKASVQQEHFASALASRRLEALISAAPRPTRPQTILVGCPSGEQHTFSLLLLSLFLSRRGFKVVYLGADTPIERLEETFAAIHPDMLILAAQHITTAAALQAAAAALQGSGVTLAYGGWIFNHVPGLRERIPAHFLGESLDGAIPRIEQLLVDPHDRRSDVKIAQAYEHLARLFWEKRLAIEIALAEELAKLGMPGEFIGQATSFFGDGLFAALQLGDPVYLEADLAWVTKLITGRSISAGRLHAYLAAYSRATYAVLGSAGAAITGWIGSYLARLDAANPGAAV